MKVLLKRNAFEFTVDKAFAEVINNCKTSPRKEQAGTWITEEVKAAYILLHQLGHAHSAEAWLNGELVGGCYGIRIGRAFFGESMFSQVPNASKYAFISYAEELKKENVALIDCQVYTPHLESLGAKMIDRDAFMQLLEELL